MFFDLKLKPVACKNEFSTCSYFHHIWRALTFYKGIARCGDKKCR